MKPLDRTADKAQNRASVLGGLAVFGHCSPDPSPLWLSMVPGKVEKGFLGSGVLGGGDICTYVGPPRRCLHLFKADARGRRHRESKRGEEVFH